MRGMIKTGILMVISSIVFSTAAFAADDVKPMTSMIFVTSELPSVGAQTQPAGASKIRCDQPVFEFSEIWAGKKVEHTFIIHNDGDAVLIIPPAPNGVQAECGCTVCGPYDERIEPGKEGRIPIVFNTKPNQHGPVTKKITINSNDPVTPRLILTFKGSVKTAIDMQPAAGASWGRYTAGSPDSITVTLRNNLDEPWNLVYQADPAHDQQNTFDIVVNELEKGKAAEARISLRKPVKAGSTVAHFKITTGLKQQPEVMIKANVFLPPPLENGTNNVIPGALLSMGIPLTQPAGQNSAETKRP